MKKYLVIVISVFFLFSATGHGGEAETTDYYTLVKMLKSNNRAVDFKTLRLGYTKTPDYNPYNDDSGKRNAMFEALGNKKYEEAAQQAESILEKNHTDLEAHFVCRIAYRERGNSERYDYHQFILKGLVDSITGSNDGKTPETAFVVIAVQEEYFVLNIFGFKTLKSSLQNANGHDYDKMEVEHKKTGEKAVFYFNVDMPYTWLNKKLQ
jgi:hypothetical protein